MPLFFGLGRPIEATVDIVALTGVTGYLAYTWGQVDLIAGPLFGLVKLRHLLECMYSVNLLSRNYCDKSRANI